MACQVPVIGSHIGGLTTYIVNNLNGFFFETGNGNDLKEKIYYYLKLNNKTKVLISKNARITALNYDSKKVVESLIQTIKVL